MVHLRSLVSLGMLLAVQCMSGCSKHAPLERLENQSSETSPRALSQYPVLREEPINVLKRLATEYPSDLHEFRRLWIENATTVELDGTRTVELLEIASFADLTCHPVEYRLRVATLDFIESRMDKPGVLESLQWIKSSYKSGFPEEVPGDDQGQFLGLQVESMNIRMKEYASELLSHEVRSQHRPRK